MELRAKYLNYSNILEIWISLKYEDKYYVGPIRLKEKITSFSIEEFPRYINYDGDDIMINKDLLVNMLISKGIIK